MFVGLSGLAILLCWFALVSPALEQQIVCSSLSMFALCISLLAVLAPRSHQFGLADFRLGSWILAFAAVAYGLAAISLVEEQTGSLRVVDRSLVPIALLVVGFGFIAFTIGYKAGPAHYIRRGVARLLHASTTRDLGSGGRLMLAYGLGLAATAGLITVQGGYGYIGGSDLDSSANVSALVQPLTILTFLRTASLYAVSARWASSRTPGALFVLFGVASIEATVGLLSGVKESFVVVVLAVGIPIVLNRRPRRVPWVAAIVAAATFVLFVTPFVTALRGEVRGGGERLDFGSSVSLGLDSLLGDRGRTTAIHDENVEQITTRVRLVDNAVVIIDKTPATFSYRPVTDILVAPVTGLVPRALWPSKPLRLSGLEFYRTYYAGQGTSSSAITMQGSLYMHGGWLVVTIGMFTLGTCIRGVDDAVSSETRAGSLLGGLLPLVLFIPIVKQELDIETLLASIPIYVITYLVSMRAISTRLPKRGASARKPLLSHRISVMGRIR